MDKIPTAEQFSKKYNSGLKTHEEMAKGYIEFAKLHVKAALEAASENGVKMSSNKRTIINSYPLSNIK